ncbi:MAG: nuclear transport factor 2 family protein [Myxococcota bacterium]|nr:nuclear transport factor 2 family protein [Myxococcota bacterium]
MDNETIIRDFIAAWSRLDPAELGSYFSDEGVYYNMPASPVTGRENIEKMIAGFISAWTATQWDVVNLVSAGEIVIAERLDRTKAKGGKGVDLPCAGVFEMENGKIKIWRDYFDMATYARGMS